MDNLHRIKKLMEDVDRGDVNSYEYVIEAEKTVDENKKKEAKAIVKKYPQVSMRAALRAVEVFKTKAKNLPPDIIMQIAKNPERNIVDSIRFQYGDDIAQMFIDSIKVASVETGDNNILKIIEHLNVPEVSEISNDLKRYLKYAYNKTNDPNYISFGKFLMKNKKDDGAGDLTGQNILFLSSQQEVIEATVYIDINFLTVDNYDELLDKVDIPVKREDNEKTEEHIKRIKEEYKHLLILEPKNGNLNENKADIFKFIHRKWVFPLKYRKILLENIKDKDKNGKEVVYNVRDLLQYEAVKDLKGIARISYSNINRKDLTNILNDLSTLDKILQRNNERLKKVGLDVTLSKLRHSTDDSVYIYIDDDGSDEVDILKKIKKLLELFDNENIGGQKYGDMLKIDSEKIYITPMAKIVNNNRKQPEYGNDFMKIQFDRSKLNSYVTNNIEYLFIIFDKKNNLDIFKSFYEKNKINKIEFSDDDNKTARFKFKK